ncbi:MAG: hypothetical protein K0Q76_326 [Panacagrimonas sp.]|jgi:steroid delta-isomerase-like uncharacterized protein|nr:ester cyclase [Panacagrimonas sp.]MCC2655218.1 hypothetical protein [Panacagrimonas sp.]
MSETNAEVRRLLERHYAAWSSGDVEGVVACYAEGCAFEDLALEARFDGTAGVRSFVQLTFAAIPDFKWNPRHITVDGERVACEWVMDGTQRGDLPGIPGTGKRFDVRGLSALVVRGGKIHENRDYWSLGTYLRQIGQRTLPEPQ